MPKVEAAACGVTISSVDYSAMAEIVENLEGYKIPVIRLFREMETNANRAYPDIDAMVKIFKDFFVDHDENYRKNKSEQTTKLCLDNYTWEHVGKVWDECFDSINISSKKDWSSTSVSTTNHETAVPNNLNAYELVKYLTTVIANDDKLFYSAIVQSLLRDAVYGIANKGGGIRSLNINDLTSPVENYITNKINSEKCRLNPRLLNPEDYLL
jgi:hypothetical protein